MDDDLKGVTGWARLLASDWISESNTWTGMQNKEREIRQYDWAVQHLQQEDAKDIKNAQDANRGWFGAQVSTEELDQLTKAALIENRLKYIIANANKSEDRLTRWDIENAEKNTSVLSFYSLKRRFSAAGVNSQMRALKDELQGNFDKEARNYQELGGTNDYLLSFNSVQRIREWNLAEEGKVPLDQTINVLESIQVPAALKEGGFVGA
jgi:NADH dehydrogenase/NADH:ubiquinone oxidoreductase subunit G